MSSEVLTIRVNSELKAKLDQLGKILHRSKSYMAEQAISQYVDDNAWQIAELAQAEEEIKQAKFVAGNAVNDYLDSWGSGNEGKAPKG
jgi:predicted transcriptional regulator